MSGSLSQPTQPSPPPPVSGGDAGAGPPEVDQRGRSRVPLIVGGVVLVAVIGVIVALSLAGGGHTIAGTFSLFDSEVSESCQGSGGYEDIRPGADVTIRNETGATIATGALGSGEYASGFGCDYDFSVEGVPDAAFYRIEVSHRGEVEYSKSEMEQQDWTVQLSLGDV
jgi:hypothetical protein